MFLFAKLLIRELGTSSVLIISLYCPDYVKNMLTLKTTVTDAQHMDVIEIVIIPVV